MNWLEGSRPTSRSIEDLLNAESVQNKESNFVSPSRENQNYKISSSIEEKKKKLTQAGFFQSKIPNSSLYSSNYGARRADTDSGSTTVTSKKASTEYGRFGHASIKTTNSSSTPYTARSWNSSSESEREAEKKIKSIIKENPFNPSNPDQSRS